MGGKTYVISLPSPWVKKYGIKKSEELDVVEEGSRVIVSTGKGQSIERVKIDVSNTNSAYAWWAITSAYIKGADEIEIVFKTKEESKIISEIVQSLIGFAILQNNASSYLLKDVSGSASDFEPMFRRIFFTLESMSKDGLNAAKKLEYSNLASIRQKDYEINKHVNFCLRYLNKKGYAKHAETSYLYCALRELEALGDDYTDLFSFIAKTKLKLTNNITMLIDETNKMLAKYSAVFYEYDKEKVLEIISLRYDLSMKIEELIKKAVKDEAIALAYIRSIISLIFNLTELKLVSLD